MSSYDIRINLQQLEGAGVARVKGKSGEQVPCLVIPIKKSHLFLGEKGVYLSLSAWENKDGQVGQFGDTHGIKQMLDKETREKMTEEERRAMPFLGNMRPKQMQQQAQPVSAVAIVQQEDMNDLPF